MPQAWVPRAFNAAFAAFLLLFLVPLLRHFGSRPVSVKIVLVVVALPVVLAVLGCLSSAVRPGSVGRFLRRAGKR